jgi:large subunit ribosomal protein L1
VANGIEKEKLHSLDEAIEIVKKCAGAKFVESIDLAIRLGIDPRKSDQNVRGITSLPHGTGKKAKVIAVLAKGEAAKAAEQAGADIVGDEDLIAKVQAGFKDFDVMIASEEMAPQIGKIAKILGPRTPNKKSGTVTNDVASVIKEIKGATRIEYRIDKAANVHLGIGKVSFTDDQIKDNFLAAFGAVLKAKPSTAKGKYIISATLSSTMGPGVKIDVATTSKMVV